VISPGYRNGPEHNASLSQLCAAICVGSVHALAGTTPAQQGICIRIGALSAL
jgi:hypothetical protein